MTPRSSADRPLQSPIDLCKVGVRVACEGRRAWRCRMEADGVLSAPVKPVPADIVHESGRTRITRLVLPGGTVIRKEPLGADGERRVRHEGAMLERLRGVAGGG